MKKINIKNILKKTFKKKTKIKVKKKIKKVKKVKKVKIKKVAEKISYKKPASCIDIKHIGFPNNEFKIRTKNMTYMLIL